MVPARGKTFGKLDDADAGRGVQQHGQGLARQDRGVVPYLLGQPGAAADLSRRCRATSRRLPTSTGRCRRDHLRDLLAPGTGDLPAIGKTITDKKVVIGVIDHHTLQVERPDQVAALIREALKHIPPERLVISSDCGMGREGMSRRHAAYKMVAMVLGTNLVRKELGLPEAECLAADPRYSLATPRAQ